MIRSGYRGGSEFEGGIAALPGELAGYRRDTGAVGRIGAIAGRAGYRVDAGAGGRVRTASLRVRVRTTSSARVRTGAVSGRYRVNVRPHVRGPESPFARAMPACLPPGVEKTP